MCDPVTITAVALVASAAATTIGTVSAVNQANYKAKVADQNAKLAKTAADDALDRGKRDQQLQGRKVAATMGAQRAAMSANGVDTTFGSAIDLTNDTAMLGAEDAQTLRENTIRESKGFSIQQANFRSEAAAARASKVGIVASGVGDLAGTIMGGAKQGVFG